VSATTSPRQLAILGVLIVALAWLAYGAFQTDQATGAGAPSNTSAPRGGGGAAAPEVTDVKLHLLEATREAYSAPRRDPFRFKPKPAPPPPRTPPPPPLANLPPPGPPPPPAIGSRIRVLGIMQGESGVRVASLSDGTAAPPILAVEGDIVLGRYRVLRVDADAVEMDYADGSGARARIPLPPPTR
jgi:hypothetical protein